MRCPQAILAALYVDIADKVIIGDAAIHQWILILSNADSKI
jgi:hypothetical protein